MTPFIHIRTSKFPVLPEEREEAVNEGMWGKALAQHLQAKLKERGYDAPFVCAEDWGWWVELAGVPFRFGVCIYSGPAETGLMDFAVTDGVLGAKSWSWRQFKFIDTRPATEKLHRDLLEILRGEAGVTVVGVKEDCPDMGQG